MAVTCNGKSTPLYVDSVMEDRADTALAVLPGAIGVRKLEPCFGGCIDEVRIWRDAATAGILRKWM